MILSKNGEVFQYGDITYTIGEQIAANNQSEYEGLVGVIIEIRDGDDKETENDTPDIYCQFDIPVLDFYRNLGLDPHDPECAQLYTIDGLHFNDAGHAVIAECLKNFIESL